MSGILFGEISVNKDWLINIENLDKIYTLTGKISVLNSPANCAAMAF